MEAKYLQVNTYNWLTHDVHTLQANVLDNVTLNHAKRVQMPQIGIKKPK